MTSAELDGFCRKLVGELPEEDGDRCPCGMVYGPGGEGCVNPLETVLPTAECPFPAFMAGDPVSGHCAACVAWCGVGGGSWRGFELDRWLYMRVPVG